MLDLQIIVDGKLYSPDSDQWIQQLAAFVDENLTLSEGELEHMAGIIKEEIKQDILQGKDFEGNALLPLMPSTIRAKGHAKPLIDTYNLLNSIAIARVGKQSYEIFTSVDYAGYLQFGTKRMVSRPFFGYTPAADSLINQYLKTSGYKLVA